MSSLRRSSRGRLSPLVAEVLGIVLGVAGLARAEVPPPRQAVPAPASSPSRPKAPHRDGYLVAPLVNESGVAGLDWMGSALAMTLAERLESLPALRPAYGATVLAGWPAAFDEAEALRRAQAARARWVIAGSYARPNWKIAVRLRLLEVVKGGAPDGGAERAGEGGARLVEVVSAERVGARESLYALLDGAMDEVLAARGWLPPETDAAVLAALHAVPTKDLYALTLYGRAIDAFLGRGGAPDLAGAEKALSRTVFIDPKFAAAHRMLGQVLLAEGKPEAAAGRLAHALDLRPGYYAALVTLARLYHEGARAGGDEQAARRRQALELADRALAQRGWDLEVRRLRGELRWELGNLDGALDDLLPVAKARPRDEEARRALAGVYAARGEIEHLAEQLAQLGALRPDDLEVKLELGAAWMRLGRDAKALAVYQDVLARDPKQVQALKFIGDLHRRSGQPALAITAYERMRRQVPDDPRPYFLLGALYAETGDDAQAVAILQEAQRFKGYLGATLTDLGGLALRRGDYKKAEALLTKAVTTAPRRPKAHFNYALLLDATERRAQALTEARTAVSLAPADADVRYLMGVLCLRLGRLDEAESAFAEAVRLDPQHADARHNLALLEDLARRYGSEGAVKAGPPARDPAAPMVVTQPE